MTIRLVDNIGSAVSRNPLVGMVFAVISWFGAQVQQLGMFNETRHVVVSLAADLGIIVGFLIGLLTLAIKSKDFYKKYFKESKDTKEDKEDE